MTRCGHAVILPILAVLLAAVGCESGLPGGPTPHDPPPPGTGTGQVTWTITGIVREPNGPALAGVLVEAWGSIDGRVVSWTTRTGGDGTFSIQLRAGQYLSFESPEHFRMAWVVPATASPGQSFDIAIKLQRRIRASAGTPVTSLLTADDATFTHLSSAAFGDGTYACGPCQQVTVAPPTSAGILRLTWTGDVPLTLWAGGGWNAPRRYTGQSGAREIAIDIADVPLVDTLLIGLEPATASGQIGLPVTYTVAIHLR